MIGYVFSHWLLCIAVHCLVLWLLSGPEWVLGLPAGQICHCRLNCWSTPWVDLFILPCLEDTLQESSFLQCIELGLSGAADRPLSLLMAYVT
jgi:hypothetical protein